MRPVVTPAEMAAVDAAASEPVETLIRRAGWATAGAALDLLERGAGSRVTVIAGKGNNGADGRAAARFLARRGVAVDVVEPGAGARWRPDLVIDAAYGTGFRGEYHPAPVGAVPVLAVDIPSGVDGLTGTVGGSPLAAVATVIFVAPKPGLLLSPGRELAGRLIVADIGLDPGPVSTWHLGPDDLVARWPSRPTDAHKWQRAVWVVGGQPAMTGAPALAAAGAARAGAGYVAVSVPPAPGRRPVLSADSPDPHRGGGPAGARRLVGRRGGRRRSLRGPRDRPGAGRR